MAYVEALPRGGGAYYITHLDAESLRTIAELHKTTPELLLAINRGRIHVRPTLTCLSSCQPCMFCVQDDVSAWGSLSSC